MMKFFRYVLAGLALFVAGQKPAQAANWYIDKKAAGAKTGKSWTDAWTDFSAISWASIAPGDTVWVSQGVYGSLKTKIDGAPGNPITFRPSRDQGRNGGITNLDIGIVNNWITVDGSMSDSYAGTYITNTFSVTNLVRNIGWHVISTNSANVDDGGTCVDIVGSATNGVVVRWLELTQLSDHQEDYGVRYSSASPHCYANCEVGYCWIHHVGQDGVKNAAGSNATRFDAVNIHHCLMELMGDDGVELNDGYTVANCIIRNTRDELLRGHPDGIAGQTWNWSKFYNNLVWGFRRSQCFYPNTLQQSNHDLYIYGNLVYWGDTNTVENSKTVGSVGMEDLYWDSRFGHVPGSSATNIYWSNIRIFNNTFAACPPYSTMPFSFNNRYKNGWTSNQGQWCTIWTTNVLVFNNSFYMGVNASFGVAQNIVCDRSRMTLGYNNGWSSSEAGKSFGSDHGSWPTGEAMNVATGWIGNSSAQPQFVSPGAPNWDYRPSNKDTALRQRGANLTAYIANMPGLNVDLYGTPRGATWDIGAVQYANPDTNLLVWLTFQDGFAGSDHISDLSGNGNHAWRFGRPSYPTNWPLSAVSTNWTRRSSVKQVAQFRKYDGDGWGTYDFSGDYAGITNVARMMNMHSATIAFWGAYQLNNQYQNSTFLSAGDNVLGSWGFGRYYTNATRFYIITNTAGPDRQFSKVLPDSWNSAGSQWHHYAATFNNGSITVYYDGVLFDSFTSPATALNVGHYAYAPPWIGVGCWTHNGTPPMEDEQNDGSNANDYPNNGWFKGAMDDVRIYNRVLSATEIQKIAADVFASPNRPPPPLNLRVVKQGP